MTKEFACCFTGHRVVGSDLNIATLRRGIEFLINKGVYVFIAGGALGFDTICAQEVLLMKEKYPQIQLHIYAPCNNQAERWKPSDVEIYEEILKGADYVDMPDIPYYVGCMKDRNYKMVDNAAYCIAYLNNISQSGTAQTVRYAKSKHLTVYNIAGKE